MGSCEKNIPNRVSIGFQYFMVGNWLLFATENCSEFGNMSQELNSILYLSSLSIFVGAVYGGIMSTKTTYIDFIKNHQATAFKNHLDAKVIIKN